jgi:hypothetical protein
MQLQLSYSSLKEATHISVYELDPFTKMFWILFGGVAKHVLADHNIILIIEENVLFWESSRGTCFHNILILKVALAAGVLWWEWHYIIIA